MKPELDFDYIEANTYIYKLIELAITVFQKDK